MFKTEALGLEAVIDMVERDLPGWVWGVGRCPCGHEEGDYSARMTSPDFSPPGMALDLRQGALVSVPGDGHDLGAHGKDAAEALARVYGLAMTRGGAMTADLETEEPVR